MNPELKSKLELLALNKNTIDKAFFLEMGITQVVGALLFASAGLEVDIDRLKEARKILSRRKGVFSAFRAVAELVVTSRMALSEDPEGYLNDLIEVYDIMMKGRVLEDSYLLLSAMIIVDRGRKADADEIREKTNELMRRMSKLHPILTSNEDIALVSLLAMTGRDNDSIINDMEECYTYTRKEIRLKAEANSIQALSEILALTEGDMKAKCDKVAELFNAFREQRSKFGTYLEFPALGTLINVDVPTDALVAEIIEAADFLKQNKGFGGLSMDKKTRLMFAALLASQTYLPDDFRSEDFINTAVVTNNAIAMAVAEEIAIMVIIMCSASTNNN